MWEALAYIGILALVILAGYTGYRFVKGWLDKKNG